MFKNQAIKIQMVKIPKDDPVEEKPPVEFGKVDAVIRDYVKSGAILIFVGYGLKKFFDTASEVSLIVARSKYK